MVDLEATLRSALDGRYTIEHELGRGGMSVVFRAHDCRHNRPVAIKVLKPELSAALSAERFHREIEVVAGLTHPHILPLHDSGEVDGLLYFVMPYIEGESLRAQIEREGRLPISHALRFAEEIAGALGFAHRNGVVHRDVKPGNILLSDGHALLTDFGVARLAGSPDGELTGTGFALGTPAYFSPEQASGEHEIDGRSDLYSLGCLLYEMLTGTPPFAAPNLRGLITQHLIGEPPNPSDRRPEVPPGIDAIVRRAMQKAPEDRFQAAEELVAALKEARGEADGLSASGLRESSFRGWRTTAIVLALFVLLVLAGLAIRRTLSPPVFTGFYPTYAVLPYEGEELTPAELRLSQQAARKLYFHLLDWESIAVRGGPSLQGPTMRVTRAGFALPTTSLESGLKLAEEARASHLIYVEAGARADSVDLVATIYELGDRRPDLQVQAEGPSADLVTVTGRLAVQILELSGDRATLEDILRRSRNHVAQQHLEEGRDAQRAWRLAEAEEHFRAAIEADPEFALAHYLLATTLYWRTVRDRSRTGTSGEDIRYHLQRAHLSGDSTRLRPGERHEVDAFRAFWDGEYERARARYDSILARDPSNLEALILAGSVEYDDPWLETGDRGLRPRGDWNRAWALFDSALALTGDEALAWGRLFDLHREVVMTAYEETNCPMRLRPGGPPVRPYESPDVERVQPVCPIVDGGEIGWVSPRDLESVRHEARRELTALQDRLLGRVRFWADAIDTPRPHEELADWILWQRSHLGCAGEPATADSLLREARHHASRALELRSDTTPEDRVRLAVLQAAGGELVEAVEATDRALSELGDWRRGAGPGPPIPAVNVYLAAGRGGIAAEILEVRLNVGSVGVPDSASSGGKVQFGRVWGTHWALGALGMTDNAESELVSRFAALDRTWEALGYGSREKDVLRRYATTVVSTALVRLPGLWDDWFGDWVTHGFELPPAWRGLQLVASDPDAARLSLDASIDSLRSESRRHTERYDYYLPIVLARRLGDAALASDLARRARGCPLRLDWVDLGWGMGDLLETSQEAR
jgi:tetratricopeptide (TPR) repeat protein